MTGHEGRHRTYALMQAGVTKFPVVVYSSAGAQLQAQPTLQLDGQDFGFARAPGIAITLTNAVPITYANRALLPDTGTWKRREAASAVSMPSPMPI